MTTFHIYIAQTKQLAQNAQGQGKHGEYALDIAEDTIVGAFSHVDDHSCIVTRGSEVSAPQQLIMPDFRAEVPCTSGIYYDYPDLTDWWDDYWGQCRDDSSYHTLMLITNTTTGSGLTYGTKYSTLTGGKDMLALPNNGYSQYNYGEAYWGPWVLLHELGHALIEGKSGSWEHNSGDTFYNNGYYYRSPFASDQASGGNHYNECNEYVSGWGTDRIALKWNDCATAEFQ